MNTAVGELNEVQQRAAWYVNLTTSGRHQDKRLAEIFKVTPNMAYRLKRGEGWTVSRIEQAARYFGQTFVDCVFGPVTGQAGGNFVANQIAQFRSRVDDLAADFLRGPFADRDGPGSGNGPRVAADGPVRADRVALRHGKRAVEEAAALDSETKLKAAE